MLSHYGHRYLVSGPLLVTIEWRAYLLATSLITIPLAFSQRRLSPSNRPFYPCYVFDTYDLIIELRYL